MHNRRKALRKAQCCDSNLKSGGIMYLTKTDEEFVQTYVTGRKPWF